MITISTAIRIKNNKNVTLAHIFIPAIFHTNYYCNFNPAVFVRKFKFSHSQTASSNVCNSLKFAKTSRKDLSVVNENVKT